MNDEYSEAFKSIIPDAPTSDGWADGARRKRRNRRRVLTGGAGVAVLALAVPFALSLQSQSMLVATPGESNTASPVVPDPAQNAPGAAACWEPSGDPRKATDEGATDGAIRAWLCGDAGAPESFPGAVGPLEPLVDGVDDIVKLVQMWEAFDYEVDCTADGGTEYRIVLDYPDGSHRVMAGVLDDCDTIVDGERNVPGARELHDRALELWIQQRERVDAPVDVAAVPQCRPPSRSVVPDLPPAERPMLPIAPTEAVTGFTCVEDPEAEYQASVGFTLESDMVAAIAESVTSDSEEGMGRNHVPTWVTLTGPWGEALTLQGVPEGTFQWFDGDGTPMLWTPSAEVLSRLAPALEPPDGEALPIPVPGVLERAQPKSCVGVTSADAQASTLEDGSLPPAPERISLCGNGATVGPWEPLVAADLTSRAVEAFNALGEVDPESTCSAEAGNSHLVVLEYPDGTDRVLEVGLLGCRGVRTGDQVRSGGADYLDTLIGLWEEQRGGQPAVADRPGQLCPQVWSAFEIDPLREEFTHGRACIGWEREGSTVVGPAEESVLPAELVADLSAQLGTMTTVENWGQLSGDSLVLITAAGDPFTIQRIDGEGFLVSDDVEDRVWIPTGDVAERLETIFSN